MPLLASRKHSGYVRNLQAKNLFVCCCFFETSVYMEQRIQQKKPGIEFSSLTESLKSPDRTKEH